MSNFYPAAGLNHVGAYQVSGIPFAQGSIDASTAAQKISFPSVSIWVNVINNGTTSCKVGFSQNGLAGSDYFEIPAGSSTGELKLKVTELWLLDGDANSLSVVAGLSSLPVDRVDSMPTNGGTNWSGSVGVG